MTYYIPYLRVSTKRQGDSGHGLDAQRQVINEYIARKDGETLAEFTEIESGKHNDRPILKKALDHCVLTGAILIVAKLDRLSRDVEFIANLQKTGTQFVICDFPEANSFTINIFAALAMYERELIGTRTKAGLAAAKQKGIALGAHNSSCKTWRESMEHCTHGRQLGSVALVNKADEFARRMRPTLELYINSGVNTPTQIANHLNAANILTARKKRGSWTAQGVKNILTRLNLT